MGNLGWDSAAGQFTLEFRTEILQAFYQSPGLFEKLGMYLEPEFFENEYLQHIYASLIRFYEKYNKLPKESIVKQEVCQHINKGNPTEADIENLNMFAEQIFHSKLDQETLDYIENSVKNFIKAQAMKQTVLDSLDDLGIAEKHQDFMSKVESVMMMIPEEDDLGVDVYALDEVKERWKARKEGKEIKRLPTGWEEIDKSFQGGVGPGEVLSFFGPANSGKSMYLINVGANMIINKKNVLHISLEMSEEVMCKRYDQRMLGSTYDELKTGNESLIKVKELLKSRIGKLKLKRFPANEVSPQDIGMFIKRIKMVENFEPDVLIIDYGELMRAPSKYYEKRHEIDAVYNALRNLAIETNLPIFTATQMNRDALKRNEDGKIITEQNIAESYGIARILDFAVSINCSPEDTINKRSKLYLVKNRDGEKGITYKMYTDFSRALVKEWDPNIDGDFESRYSGIN